MPWNDPITKIDPYERTYFKVTILYKYQGANLYHMKCVGSEGKMKDPQNLAVLII